VLEEMKSSIAERMFTFFELGISELNNIPIKPSLLIEVNEEEEMKFDTFTVPEIKLPMPEIKLHVPEPAL
jgi:hypothetical protein